MFASVMVQRSLCYDVVEQIPRQICHFHLGFVLLAAVKLRGKEISLAFPWQFYTLPKEFISLFQVGMKTCPIFSWLHWKDHFKSLYNFVGRNCCISVPF